MDKKRIDCFKGTYKWLSNFFPSPVVFEGTRFPTVEHAYQAAKTLDRKMRQTIKALPSPSQAKKMGNRLTIRPDWEKVKLSVMEALIREKFKNPDLREKLLATDPLLLQENNTWGDTFWGTCEGKGGNHLGRLLMKIREEIK